MKPIKITASPAQERSWRDRYTLHILVISLVLAGVLGSGLVVYWAGLSAVVE